MSYCNVPEYDKRRMSKPYNDPPVLQNCHDVRKLTACPICHGLGNKENTIRGGTHGRCYVEFYGLPALLSLEKAELDKLTLGDVGAKTMRAILEQPTRPAESKRR
jgi:hypothetical protein